jgi:hypothetical protein
VEYLGKGGVVERLTPSGGQETGVRREAASVDDGRGEDVRLDALEHHEGVADGEEVVEGDGVELAHQLQAHG